MDVLVRLLQEDPAFRLWYVAGGFALMIAPMALLAAWYHRGITRTPGGRALMKRQNATRPRAKGSFLQAHVQIRVARHGYRPRRAQPVDEVLPAPHVIAVAPPRHVARHPLLWADEAARTAPP